MRKKMKLKPCIEVPFADKLYEGYEVLEGRAIIANVSVDKVKDMMADFIGMYDEPLFFFLELPGHLPEGLEEGFIDEIKKDVYYLDGFPLFREDCFFTDDTVMTCAVAEALMNGGKKDYFIDAMKKFGRMYPDAGRQICSVVVFR